MSNNNSDYTQEQEKGRVIDVRGDKVIVSMVRSDACSRCKACGKGRTENEMIVEALNMCEAKVNDVVTVELRQSDFLQAVLIAYGIPLCMFFIGCFAGFFGAELVGLGTYREPLAFLLGIGLVAVAYQAIKKASGKWNEGRFVPVVKQKID